MIGIGTTTMEFCSREEIGLNSKYKKKWEFKAKEQDGVFHQWMENY